MRPIELLRSRLFRTALLGAMLFALGFGVALSALLAGYDRFLKREQLRAVDAEIGALAAEYSLDGAGSTAALIDMKMRADPDARWVYQLFAASDGRLLAGPTAPVHFGASDGLDWMDYQTTDGRRGRAQARRLPDGALLRVGQDERLRTEAWQAVLQPLAFAVLTGLGLALAAGAQLAWIAQRPIERIRTAAANIVATELRGRLPISGNGDEFDRVAVSVNELLDRIALAMDSLRQSSDAIAHDLRTPLTRLRLRLEALQASAEHDPRLDELVTDVDRVLGLFDALLQIARLDSGAMHDSLRPLILGDIVADAVSLYLSWADLRHQRLKLSIAPDCRVRGDRDLLFAGVGNLLDNAIKYAPEHSAITVTLSCSPQHVTLEVADRGPGIPPQQRARALQRMIRLDPARTQAGYGLGLSLVRAVAEAHGGQLQLADHQPGLRAILQLPRASDAAA